MLLVRLRDHFDFPLGITRIRRIITLLAQRQEVHQRTGIHRHIGGRIDGDRQHHARHFPGDPCIEHALVGVVGHHAGFPGCRVDNGVLLRRAGMELIGPGLSVLDHRPRLVRNVEDRTQFAVTTGFLVVTGNPMPHVLTPHEDGRLHEERHGVVLEGTSMTLAHQVADQPRRTLRIRIDILNTGLTDSRDAGGKNDVGIPGTRPDKFHRDVAAKRDVAAGGGGIGRVVITAVGEVRHPRNTTRERLVRWVIHQAPASQVSCDRQQPPTPPPSRRCKRPAGVTTIRGPNPSSTP